MQKTPQKGAKDIEEFLSIMFQTDFTHEDCLYKEMTDIPRPPFAYDNYYYKIGDKFYDASIDGFSFVLYPLNDIVRGVDENEKTVQTYNGFDKHSINSFINLSYKWIMFKSIRHPELIDGYKKMFIERINQFEQEKDKLSVNIEYDRQKIRELESVEQVIRRINNETYGYTGKEIDDSLISQLEQITNEKTRHPDYVNEYKQAFQKNVTKLEKEKSETESIIDYNKKELSKLNNIHQKTAQNILDEIVFDIEL